MWRGEGGGGRGGRGEVLHLHKRVLRCQPLNLCAFECIKHLLPAKEQANGTKCDKYVMPIILLVPTSLTLVPMS